MGVGRRSVPALGVGRRSVPALGVGRRSVQALRGPCPFLPLLLVAGAAERRVERADAVEGRAADRHVRAPREARGPVALAEVERRDRGLLAPAGARRGALERCEDAAGEDVGVRVLGGCARERRQPARADADVVVEERDERARGVGDAGVASGVEAGTFDRDVARAVELGEQTRLLGRGSVLDHEDLGLRARGFGAQRRKRHVEIRQPLARRDHY